MMSASSIPTPRIAGLVIRGPSGALNLLKVGDIVIAKGGAPYIITTNGWTGMVTHIDPTSMRFSAAEYPGTPIDNLDPQHFVLGHASSSGYDAIIVDEAGMPRTPQKKIIIDASKLEDLVLGKQEKSEILAVLRQHEHADKLFKEWGLAETIQYGRGMTFMFYGPPGTGKTLAAHCIAKALGSELLTISAAEIQSSEPGAANRSIQEAFEAAQLEHKVLFLDECDSLITTRADVGMVIASEINTLLTEIEKFEGVAILATNRIETMDEALERRLSLIVEFPFPKKENRIEIWKKILPAKMPVASDVSPEVLAEHVLSGGQIKNIVLQAARMAIAEDAKEVTLTHFLNAITRLKHSSNLMGSSSRYQQGGYGRTKTSKVKTTSIDTFLDSNIEEQHGNYPS